MPEANRHVSMYGTEAMNVGNDIEEEEGDAAGGESIDNPRLRYEHQGMGDGAVGDVDGSIEAMNGVEVVQAHSFYGPDAHFTQVAASGSSDQLTLSFQGEVYVFDAVSPDKVQAVLLLLGGYEVPSVLPLTTGTQNNRGVSEGPIRLSQPQRAASLNRFREKRKERCFDKKIRYTVRKEVALRMQRKKGQFTSAKAGSDEAGSTSSDCNVAQGSGHDDGMPETLCTHCGTSSKSTPMMRRGPSGPRTLCNACGLKWANKGELRGLPKTSNAEGLDPSAKASEQSGRGHIDSEAAASVAAAAAAASVITSSNGNRPALIDKH